MTQASDDLIELLPEYVIGRELGRGGSGVVWEARHLALDRVVAVKQLDPHALVDPDQAERFRREARLLARLVHPHVVTVYDYREAEGLRLLVMEYMPGGTLADRSDGMPTSTAIAAVMAAATGLHHVHRQDVLHRDVKPENLLFDARGVLKVTDFGIARTDQEQTGPRLTRSGVFFGTPAYAAPEQVAQSFADGWPSVDARADQYALGAVLYELMSGRLTHDPSNGVMPLCVSRMNQEAVPLRQWVDVPPALDAVIMRTLRREPSERFASVEEFGVALGDAMAEVAPSNWYASSTVAIEADGPIRASAERRLAVTPARKRSKPPAPPKRRLLLIAVVAALAAALAAAAFTMVGGGTSAPPRAETAALPLSLTKLWAFPTQDSVFSSPALSGDTVVVGSHDGNVYGIDVHNGKQRWVVPTGQRVDGSAAVADGIAYVGGRDGKSTRSPPPTALCSGRGRSATRSCPVPSSRGIS